MNAIRLLGVTAVVAPCGLFALPRAALVLPPPDTLPNSQAGDLMIQPVQHASLMLGWNGRHVLVDPAPRRAEHRRQHRRVQALATPAARASMGIISTCR